MKIQNGGCQPLRILKNVDTMFDIFIMLEQMQSKPELEGLC